MWQLSEQVYAAIVGWAAGAPGWVRGLAEVGTEAVLVVFAAAFCYLFWRAGRGYPALAAIGPAVTVLAYLISELVKSVLAQDRPCRDGWRTIAECPPYGDWSLPSNHATIAAAAAVAIALSWRRSGYLVLPLAVLGGFSRVFVGVHYPHDVLAGLALGAAVSLLTVLGLRHLLGRSCRVSQRRDTPLPARR